MKSVDLNEQQIQWKDSKKYLWLLGIAMLTLPMTAIFMYELFQHELFFWYGVIQLILITPVVELLSGEDESNPPESVVQVLDKDPYYPFAVQISVYGLYVSFIYTCWYIANHDLSWISYFGLSWTAAISSGIAINTAHELGHKRSLFSRWLAKFTLAPVFYGHFFVEHNKGHHVHVSTPNDPATSRFNETFWQFLPRTVIGSIRSACEIENKRLKAKKKSFWTIENEVLHSWLLSVILWGGVVATFGFQMIPFLLIQSILGFSMLEIVNYIEHYGLERKKLPSGRYEMCQVEHSWNSNSIASNIFLYQLQRHADHHAHPGRSYQSLRHFPSSPQLPSGYGTMILVALVPPLWFKMMNPKVLAYYQLAQENEKLKLVKNDHDINQNDQGNGKQVSREEKIEYKKVSG